MTEVERFEQWHKENIGEVYLDNGCWKPYVHYAWQAWRAAQKRGSITKKKVDDAMAKGANRAKQYKEEMNKGGQYP